jgi:hypothetical protein
LSLEKLGKLEEAGMLVDYAEMLFVWGNLTSARQWLEQFAAKWVSRYKQPALDVQLNLEEISAQFLRPLGKYWRLKGQIALSEARKGQFTNTSKKTEAMQHFTRASVCFERFSPTGKETETMVELLNDELRPQPVALKRELIQCLRASAEDLGTPEASKAFVEPLSRLLGVE